MKRVKVRVARKVNVVQNAISRKVSHAFIKDAKTGEVLHAGQPRYIERVARNRYNMAVSFDNG